MDSGTQYGDIWVNFWPYIICWLIFFAFVYWYRRRSIYYPSEATPDIDMADAIDHVVSVLFPDNNPDTTNFVTEIGPAAELIAGKLRSGELTAWGKHIETAPDQGRLKIKSYFACSGKLLKKEEWENKKLIPISASIPRDDEPQTKHFGSGEGPVQFTALRVNLNQVKKLWPMENTKP
jgi:hypothetical protein